jgi:adenosylcobinamide-GDP ribazoletransferase
MKSFLAAIRFLTIVPLPNQWKTDEEDLARSVPWFPILGLLLGGIAAFSAWALSLFAPPLVVAALLVFVLLSFSGCLHLDGLSDTADGFLSSRSRERILTIMKDSHIGAMGVIAIVCLLLLKFASLASIASNPQAFLKLWPTVLLMPLAGRVAIVLQMAVLPYAREEGLGNIFYRKKRLLSAIGSSLILLAVSWGLLGLRGIVVGAACIAVALVFSFYCYRKITGATGDTFGAVCEITELMPALVMAMSLS